MTYDCGGPDHCIDDLCVNSDRGICGRWRYEEPEEPEEDDVDDRYDESLTCQLCWCEFATADELAQHVHAEEVQTWWATWVTTAGSRLICVDLGRCAYDVAAGEPDSGCPWWVNCFGLVPGPAQDKSDTASDGRDQADTHATFGITARALAGDNAIPTGDPLWAES